LPQNAQLGNLGGERFSEIMMNIAKVGLAPGYTTDIARPKRQIRLG
jgi:hypothetical protein